MWARMSAPHLDPLGGMKGRARRLQTRSIAAARKDYRGSYEKRAYSHPPEVAHVQTPYGAAGVGLVATVQTLMAH